MKNSLLLSITLCVLSCGTSSKNKTATINADTLIKSNAKTYATTITSDELKKHLYVYASDEFEGRDTGEAGQQKAIAYLKEQYQNMNVGSPFGTDNYFQKVPLEKQKVATGTVTVNGEAFNTFENHAILTASNNLTLNTNTIVYAGYGIDTDKYSDYKTIDVKGKIVLARAGEPTDSNGNYVTSGTTEATKWSNGRQAISSKRDAAKANGAKGFLLMDDVLFSKYAANYKAQFESGKGGRLSLKTNETPMLMLVINKTLGQAIYPNINTDTEAKTISTNLTLDIKNTSETITSHNVLAYIEGSEQPDEIIVVSAHLDHIGIKDGEVCNGADDDGSGTVAILEIAEAFKAAKIAGDGPKRSILFLHVTGEEKGLLGSRYYTDFDPVFPLKHTVANLNIDMIGRTDPKREDGDRNYIYLIGSDKLSTDLHNLSEAVNTAYCNIELDYTYNDENDPNRYYYRSDHYNFAKNNIPVIFYFNGTHEDYHQTTDTPDKIEYDLLENRARLVFYTTWELANREARITVDKVYK